jgi:integrase
VLGPCLRRGEFSRTTLAFRPVEIFSRADKCKIRRTFPTLEAAEDWRAETKREVRQRRLRVTRGATLRQAADEFIEGAKAGTVRNRSGDAYKPGTCREYERALKLRVLPALGAHRLDEIGRGDLQRLVDRWLAAGDEPSTIRNTVNAVRAVYRQALDREEVTHNPTTSLRLPSVRGRRERIATASEAAAMLDALPERDRALWATFLYAGLRRGEAAALRWTDVDLSGRVLHVRRSWDRYEGAIEPKSQAGARTVPINGVLGKLLAEHKLRSGRTTPLVWGRTDGKPFDPSTVQDRATSAWKTSKLGRLTPHECRRTYASLMIAAGVNAKALSTYMGHANIAITLDRYGHLFPGAEHEAAAMLDAYLAKATPCSA